MPANSQVTTNDDVYVNEGNSYDNGIYYPKQPKEQQEEIAAEAAPAAASWPIMASVAKWFDDQVRECNDPDSIQIDALTINGVKYERNISVEAQVLAMQLLKSKLKGKAHEFEQFLAPKEDEKGEAGNVEL